MERQSGHDAPDIAASIVRALVLYSLAEFQTARATTIRVAAEGLAFSVGDDGRGHAIDRLVDGTLYLKFVYAHLDYSFGRSEAAPMATIVR